MRTCTGAQCGTLGRARGAAASAAQLNWTSSDLARWSGDKRVNEHGKSSTLALYQVSVADVSKTVRGADQTYTSSKT